MTNKNVIINRVNSLKGQAQNRLVKYQWSYSLYAQTPAIDLKSSNPMTPGLLDTGWNDDISPKINIIKSAVDAVTSKISTSHVRPYVNAVKGSFKTIQICKQLQIFLDYYFDENNLYDMCTEALRDACVFDSCSIFLNQDDMKPYLIMPWNYYSYQCEKIKKSAYIEFPNVTTESAPDAVRDLLTQNEKQKEFMSYAYYYNVVDHVQAIFINNSIRDVREYKSDIIPIATITYGKPVIGNNALSISDMLRGIQYEIDEVMKRIAAASKKNPALTVVLNNASNVSVGELNNEIGNIIQFNSQGNQSAKPFDIITPNFISDQYTALLDNLIDKAYNMVGISQLSAQGKKTPGLDSGVAIATQEDIESDRFQTLLSNYIYLYTNVAKMMVHIATGDKTILEPSRYNIKLKWSDVKSDYDKMRIEFSAADALSKDPSQKLKQLQSLAAAGIIPSVQIASLLEIPDINRGYSAANNGFNTCMSLIDACIYDDKFDIPDYISVDLLMEQITNMQLSLKAAEGSTDENEKDIDKLNRLYKLAYDRKQELTPQQQQIETTDTSLNNAYTNMNGAKEVEDVSNKAAPYDNGMSGNSNTAASNNAQGDNK